MFAIFGVVSGVVLLVDAASKKELANEGCDFYYGNNGKIKNYNKAYEKFTESGNCRSHFYLGMMYEYGHGVNRNFIESAKHYLLAVEQGGERSLVACNNLLDSPNISATELNSIGNIYYNGLHGISRNYSKAKICFEKAILKDRNFGCAYGNLGLFYEYGREVGINSVTAIKYYQQAIDRGYANAQKGLGRVFTKDNISSDSQNRIGDMYRTGVCVQKNFVEAKKWYEKTPHEGNTKEIKELRRQKIKILEKNIRQNLKASEKNILVESYLKNPGMFNPNEIDALGNTALHRAAKNSHLKSCARIILFGGETSKTIPNYKKETAFSYLGEKAMRKVTSLQTDLNALLNNLQRSAPTILSGAIQFKNSATSESASALSELYAIEEIKPLMDWAKLAVLGLHDLSDPEKTRERFINPDYDSDEDDEEGLTLHHKLSISIDSENSTVEGIVHLGKDEEDQPDGQDGKNAVGIFIHTNTIFVGGARNKNEVRGTIIHELTHFMAQDIFKNSCNPYHEDDSKNKTQFDEIANELKEKYQSLDPILAAIFMYVVHEDRSVKPNYKASEYNRELIVRVPQMLVKYRDQSPNGFERLEREAPRLLGYYNNVFLKAAKNHIEKIENRALQDWPKELFMRNRTKYYSLQTEPQNTEVNTKPPSDPASGAPAEKSAKSPVLAITPAYDRKDNFSSNPEPVTTKTSVSLAKNLPSQLSNKNVATGISSQSASIVISNSKSGLFFPDESIVKDVKPARSTPRSGGRPVRLTR